MSTFYKSLSEEVTRIFRQSIISPKIASLNNKTYDICIKSHMYEDVFVKTINKYCNGQYMVEPFGNNNLCFDALITNIQTGEIIAMQIKSLVIENNCIKIYEQPCAAEVIKDCFTADQIIDVIVEKYNDRFNREKSRYNFSKLESLCLVKAPKTILLYDNVFDLNCFNRDEINLLSFTKSHFLNEKESDSKITRLKFEYHGNTYRFSLSNHTLSIEFLPTTNMSQYVISNNLKTNSEIVDEIIEDSFNNPNDDLFDTELSSGIQYTLLSNDFKLGKVNQTELAKTMIRDTNNVSYNELDVKSKKGTQIKYVNICEPDNKFTYVLKDSIISKTSQMYRELLDLGGIDSTGLVLKNIRVKNKKQITQLLL